MKKRFVSKGIVLLFLLGLISVFRMPSAHALLLDYHEVQITTDPNGQFQPRIDGNYIVYTDDRAGNNDVYLYNIETGVETPIAASEEDEFLNDISGNIVVYTLARFDDDDIFVYDISTGLTKQITDPEDRVFAMRREPAISGKYVVWQDNRSGNYDIYGYDLETGEEFLVSTDGTMPAPGPQEHPAIHGSLVVWEDHRDLDNPDIYVYDISTPDGPALIPADARLGVLGLQGWPDVYGRYVVFDEARSDATSNRDIVLWDLDTNQGISLTAESLARQERPRIDGTRVVWEDNRAGNRDIYTYDITTGEVDPVTTDPSTQFLCDVSGDRIVWTDMRNISEEHPGNYDIYMFVTNQPPIADANGPYNVYEDSPMTFDGTGSFDPEGATLNYAWAFGDGGTGTGATPSHTYPDPGIYTVTLTVTDPGGLSDTDTAEVAVWQQEPLPFPTAPIIDVSPTSLSFGDVEIGQSSLLIATISNYGLEYLHFTVTQTGSTDFTFTPAAATVDLAGAYVDLTVTYTPTDIGPDQATLTINSNDPDEPTIQVTLTGNGVETAVPPEQMFQDLLDLYDTNIESGKLQGIGPGNSAENRERAIRNMIVAANDLYTDGLIEEACEQLQAIYMKIDGESPPTSPPDFIDGDPTVLEELRQKVLDLMVAIGCGTCT